MPTAILTVGLPRSGKSTWAKSYVNQHSGVIINPDSFRLALYNANFIPEAEEIVWSMCAIAFKAAFIVGHKLVILDATNLTNKRREKWERLVDELRSNYSMNIDLWYKVFDTSIEVCINRAIQDSRQDLVKVIRSMSLQSEPLPNDASIYEY